VGLLALEQAEQRRDDEAAQACRLAGAPFLERRRVECVEAGQELAAVELGRPGEVVPFARRGEVLEGVDVGLDGARVERDGVAVGAE
jgi:hypothetical protein